MSADTDGAAAEPVGDVPREGPGGLDARLGQDLSRSLRSWWTLVDPWVGLVFFFGGFAWDAVTLVRIDTLIDNVILAGYLVALAVTLVVEVRLDEGDRRLARLAPFRAWVTYAAQFLFGGLLSAEIVLYAKSASIGQTLIWLGTLSVLMGVNEFLHNYLRIERLRLGLFWLCSFSFLLFFVPVCFGYYGRWLFLGSLCGASLAAGGVAAAMYWGRAWADMKRLLWGHGVTWVTVAGFVLLADAVGLVPPVPFALVDRGMFQSVERVSTGYEVSYDAPPWYAPWRDDDRVVYWKPGQKVWHFTAVFAPSGAEMTIAHIWEKQDEASKAWTEKNRIPLSLKGGRDGGYRTYSFKQHLSPGSWRVRVETPLGREIGRTEFVLEPDEGEPRVRRTRIIR